MNQALSFQKVKIYTLYWVGYILLLAAIQGLPAKDFLTALVNECFGVLPKMIFVVVVVEGLMPHFLFRKRTVFFVVAYLLLILFFGFLQRLIDNFIIIRYIMTHWQTEPLFSAPVYLYNIIKLQFVVTIPVSVTFIAHLAEEKSKVQMVLAEKLQSELSLLRNQLHPHFLFNVLNSLYSKILSQSDDSADIVLKISDMLRFSIYDINRKNITLEEEITFLKNYIDLQQLRFDNRMQLSFSVYGPTKDFVIEPFLILPFLENCFKYGLDDPHANAWITISLNVSGEWLSVKIENSLPENFSTAEEKASYSGLGIANVKRRLELLYPAQHTLIIKNEADSFLVSLKIKMNHAD